MVDWLVFSQLWKLEIQAQGAGRVGFWWTLSPWLADGTFLLCPRTVSPLCTQTLGVSASYYKDTSVFGLGPCPYDLLQFLSLPRPYLQLQSP